MSAILVSGGGLHPTALTPILPSVTNHETVAKASRQAHRWLRRRVAQPGDWTLILDSYTGEIRMRHTVIGGRVVRMQ